MLRFNACLHFWCDATKGRSTLCGGDVISLFKVHSCWCQCVKAAIPDSPIVAFRRPHNLRDLLVRAKLKETNPPTQTGNHPCNSTRCKTCHMIKIEETFKSHSTGTTHKTRSTFTCKTRNLVYLIQCRKCGLQYVGETANPLHIRMNGHRSDIHTRRQTNPWQPILS